MQARRTRAGLVVTALGAALAGCGGAGGGGGLVAAAVTSGAAGVGSGGAAPATSATSTIDFAALTADMEGRKQVYLQLSGAGSGYYAQLARLELGSAPFERAPVDDLLDFMDARKDTADFKATALLRLLFLHGANPALPPDLVARAKRTLLGFRYRLEDPGQDEMVFWSENHYLMFAAAELLAGELYPQEVFTASGLTGQELARRARPRLLRWFRERMLWGYSEWSSPVYYPHDVAPLLNLIDFSGDAEVRTRAAMALDLLLFDLARLTHRGNLGTSAGRSYEEQKLSGSGQSVGDLVQVIWGTRGKFVSPGSTGATPFATSRGYRVPHALLAIGLDKQRDRFVDRARVGLRYAEAAGEGIGLSDHQDGMFWWRSGAYLAPETIELTRDMVETWDLWHQAWFAPLRPLRNLPGPLLRAALGAVGPVSQGTLLAANTYCFRTPDAQLASAIDYAPGRVAFQQHAWQATLDLDAVVFTTHPGIFGRQGPGPWTGSASLPRITQHEDVALILYDAPPLLRAVFPQSTHAWFPRARFDEVRERGPWVCARKGKGYVALFSAVQASWIGTAGEELVAHGTRNAWICQVGREAEDGSFADFVDAVTRAPLDVQNLSGGGPLTVEYDAPGVGLLRTSWGGASTLGGAPLHAADFPRFDSPYAQHAWGEERFEVRCAGAALTLDQSAGTRAGDGL